MKPDNSSISIHMRLGPPVNNNNKIIVFVLPYLSMYFNRILFNCAGLCECLIFQWVEKKPLLKDVMIWNHVHFMFIEKSSFEIIWFGLKSLHFSSSFYPSFTSVNSGAYMNIFIHVLYLIYPIFMLCLYLCLFPFSHW